MRAASPKSTTPSADRRHPKAKTPYLWLWFAALTGIIFGLLALSLG